MTIPGPRSRALARRLRRVESRNITYVSPQFPIFWESAHGSSVRDVDGRRYLDLTAAFGVASLGHDAPAVRRALAQQSRRLWHGMGDVHPSEVKVRLLEYLARVTPGNLGVSILSSSGAEAVESALKTARLATGKAGVLAFEGAYHGLSYGTLAVTDRADFVAPFRDQIAPLAVHTPFPDQLHGPKEEACLDAAEKALRENKSIGAVLVEPMQGRGGVRIPRPFFLKELQNLARRCGALLIADEIFTGFGRTGRLFAVDHSDVVPDIICLGKALANGFPISACVGTPDVMAAWPESDGEAIHTSTFLGNPLGCAMALASLAEMEKKKLASRAASLGAWWKEKLMQTLADHPRVGEIRGAGLMIGIELVQDRKGFAPDARLAGKVVLECLQRRLLVLSGGTHRNVISLTPPLTISKDELEQAAEIIKGVLYGTHSSGH